MLYAGLAYAAVALVVGYYTARACYDPLGFREPMTATQVPRQHLGWSLLIGAVYGAWWLILAAEFIIRLASRWLSDPSNAAALKRLLRRALGG